MNFLIDGVILLATAWARRTKISWLRIIASATIGALYVVFIFFPSLSFFYTFFIKFMFSVVMIIVAFGWGSLQHVLANLVFFYMVNFAIAGGVLGINYYIQSSNEMLNGIWLSQSGGMRYELKIGIVFLIIAIPVLLWIYRTVFQSAQKRQNRSSYMAEVTIHVGELESTCTGLIDTGNQLYEPLTRTPVMIVEASLWEHIFPEGWQECLRTADTEQLMTLLDQTEFVWQDRLRFVPYRGFNKGMQFMVAVKPDQVVIQHYEQTIESTKVLVGLDCGKLCADGSYRAIIHPALVEI